MAKQTRRIRHSHPAQLHALNKRQSDFIWWSLGLFFAANPDSELDRTVKPYLKLADAFFETFPQLHAVQFSHAWSRPIALTTRMAVHFQSFYKGKALYAEDTQGLVYPAVDSAQNSD